MLCVMECLVRSCKVKNGVDENTPLLHEVYWRHVEGYDVLLRYTKSSRLIETLLPHIAHDDASAEMQHNLKCIEAQTSKTKQEARLRGLHVSASSDGMVSCVHSIGSNGCLRGRHTLRNCDYSSRFNHRVGSVEAILANAGVVASFADLREISAAFWTISLTTAWNRVQGDHVPEGECRYSVSELDNRAATLVSLGVSVGEVVGGQILSYQCVVVLKPSRLVVNGEEGVVAAAYCGLVSGGRACSRYNSPPEASSLIRTCVGFGRGTATSSRIWR